MKSVDLVKRILEQQPETRDSDKKLLLAFWEVQGLGLSDTQKKIFSERCSTAETITRARRALKHIYPASPEVDSARFEKYMDYKYNRPYAPADED